MSFLFSTRSIKEKFCKRRSLYPEGFTLKQIFRRLKEELDIDSFEFFLDMFIQRDLKKVWNRRKKIVKVSFSLKQYYFTDEYGGKGDRSEDVETF